MNNNKLQEDLRELRRQAGYEPNAWYDQKEEEYLSQLLSDTEKRVREEPVPVDDSMRYVKPTHLLERWKLLKDLPGIPKGTIFIEEQDPERCGYRYYPDLDTDINMQYNTDWFFRENPDWFDLLKGVLDGK